MPQIKNLKQAARRVKEAVKKGEKIILCSDADLDGTASLIILEEALESLGGNVVERYFPNREKEGYGLSFAVLKKLQKHAPGLLIIADSGIANFAETARAQELGFTVIIIDHHELINRQLPPARFIINPKQPADSYPFKLLAACGLCFLFAKELLGPKMSKRLEQSFLEITAIATLADMMPEEKDNQELIEKGLNYLCQTNRPALKVLLSIFSQKAKGRFITSRFLAQQIIGLLQLSDFQGHFTESYLFLSSSSQKKAEKLAQVLVLKNKKRRSLIKKFTDEIASRFALTADSVIVKNSRRIPHLITGNIASKLSNYFKKPVVIISQKQGISRGSGRSPKEVNLLDGLTSCSSFLQTYGGHPQAAGFSIKTDQLASFKKCLRRHFSKN